MSSRFRPISLGRRDNEAPTRNWDPTTAEPERIREWKTYNKYVPFVEMMKEDISDDEKIMRIFEEVLYFSKEGFKDTARVALQQVIIDHNNSNWDS